MYSRKIKRTKKINRNNRKRSKKRTKKVDKKYLISLAKKYKVNYKSLSNKKIAKNLIQTNLTKKEKLYILPLLPNWFRMAKNGSMIQTPSTGAMIVTRRPPNKITLETSYSDLVQASRNLYYFFKGHNFGNFDFINFITDIDIDRITFTFTQSEFQDFNRGETTWDGPAPKLDCVEKVENGIIYKTYCDIPVRDGPNKLYKGIKQNDKDYPRTQKVFFLMKNKVDGGHIRHLYDYIKNIKSNDISFKSHNTIFNDIVFKNLKKLHEINPQLNVVNHNLDIPFLHFKFE